MRTSSICSLVICYLMKTPYYRRRDSLTLFKTRRSKISKITRDSLVINQINFTVCTLMSWTTILPRQKIIWVSSQNILSVTGNFVMIQKINKLKKHNQNQNCRLRYFRILRVWLGHFVWLTSITICTSLHDCSIPYVCIVINILIYLFLKNSINFHSLDNENFYR